MNPTWDVGLRACQRPHTVPDAILNGSNFFCEFSARFAAREAS